VGQYEERLYTIRLLRNIWLCGVNGKLSATIPSTDDDVSKNNWRMWHISNISVA